VEYLVGFCLVCIGFIFGYFAARRENRQDDAPS
jgi:hypothetical protein